MTTYYTNTVTIAVPESLLTEANHLAVLMGTSAANIGTFTSAAYTSGTTDYAVGHGPVKAVFLEPTQTGELPPTPPHAEGIVDRALAQAAFDTLNTPEGIWMAVDVDPHEQFAEWGLTRIPTEEPV